MNVAVVVVAAVAAFAFSAVYYIALRQRAAALSAPWAQRARPPRWRVPLELARSLVVASAVAASGHGADQQHDREGDPEGQAEPDRAHRIRDPDQRHENTPLGLAAIHGGDWLAKLLIMALIMGAWR